MNNQAKTFMMRVRRAIAGSVVAAAAFAVGCVPQDRPNTGNVDQANTNRSVPANTQPSPSPTDQGRPGTVFTLPLLDALLSNDDFVSEAKSGVQLSEDELQQLRDAARDAVLNLSDDESDTGSHSTRKAVTAARTAIEKILGPERSRRFAEIVSKYGGNEQLADTKPNQVPTDTRIVVNSPAYRMDIFDKGKLVQSYEVGIGYPEFPLPIGLRKAKTIIFNPTWTPPDEPWVKGKVAPGKKVEAGSKLNPLGPIKIPIGLPNLIHGGKSPSRLGTFASHGCVGLTNDKIQDFAAKLSALGGQELSQEDIRNYEKQKTQTKEIDLAQPVPVELRYETIVLENGTLKIYRDVYERGTNTEDELRKVLEAYGVSLDQIQPQLREQILAGLHQMAIDAKGNPVDETEVNQDQDKEKAKHSDKDNSNKSGKVTTTVKGKKVLEFQIPELAGKGYPAPVGAQF